MEENVLEQILEGSTKPTDLPLETLREITNNFSTDRVIGGGGFATVYKGVLRNSNSVAVKKIMSNMTINEKLFHREVGSLMEVNHQNIVRFLGFSSNTVETPVKNPEAEGYIFAEKRERLLCFEYINNGSLDNYITDELRGLDWDTRFQIIKGISMGLCYLHMEKRILHMDLKPANILLDNQMVPKITDFGLSRPVGNSQTTSTDHYCTLGYAAPENMFLGGRMTVKSDIYSLGVIIIELVTGHKGVPYNSENVFFSESTPSVQFCKAREAIGAIQDSKATRVNCVLRRWRHRWKKSGSEMQLAYQQVTKCLEIGLLCQAVESNKRPFISKIVSGIGEMENMNNYNKNVDEPIVAKIHPPYLEDDMLGIEPLDLWFAEHNNKHTLSCSVELSNNAGGFIAFEIRTTSPLPYSIVPNNGIVAPRSKLIVDITRPTAKHDNDMEALQYGTKQYTDNFIVRSIKVDDSLTTKDLNEGIFDTGMVDEVHLNVVSDNQLVAPCTHEEPEEILYADIAPAISPQFTSCSPDPNPQPVCNPLFKSLMHLLFLKRKMKPIFMKNGGPALEKANNIMIYRREDLRPILKSGNFIGKGVFGEVYKGYLDNRLVAVKKPITNCLAHNEQFANEVIIQSQVIHKNIVRLIGCCLEVDIPMLVYEFLSKGSLNDTLHNNNRTPLDLDVRLNIAAESAEGLAYMHSKTSRTILHGDVKPANILLDDDYVPKISDFGISRLIAGDKELTTSVIGDRSYMDPVYLQTGLLTEKSDVYSFGVVVLELVSRRKATYSDNNSLVRNFLDAHKKEKIPIELFDTEFAEPGDLELLGSLAGLAMDCLNLDVDERPAMTDVVERLLILKRSRK